MTPKTPSLPDDAVLRIIDAAVDLQQAGERDKSIELLLEAQKRAPEYAPIHLLLGLAYRDAGRMEEAEARLERAIHLDPQQTEALQTLGLLLTGQGRHDEAISVLQRHMALAPGNLVTLRALSNQLAALDRANEGIALFERAWAETGNPETGWAFARYLMRVRQPKRAEAVFSQVAPALGQPKPLVEWASVLVTLRRPADAVPVLEQAIAIDPDFAAAWKSLGDAHGVQGQFPQALQAAERALAINDQNAQNWRVKANALLALGRTEEALQTAQMGLRWAEGDVAEAQAVRYSLQLVESQALSRLGRHAEALESLIQLGERYPNDLFVVSMAADTLNALDRSDEALQILNRAEAAGVPEESNLTPIRYTTLHLLGRGDEARKLIEPQLANHRGERLELLASLAVSVYAEGHVEASRRMFEQLLQFDPDMPRALLGLGFIVTGEGRLDEASDHLSRVLSVDSQHDVLALALVDLAYLDLLKNQPDAAIEHLERAKPIMLPRDRALMRVAYWYRGQVEPDYHDHPSGFMLVSTAVSANLVSAHLAVGRAEAAQELAQHMIDSRPNSRWGYKMLGLVLSALSDSDGARRAWLRASELAQKFGDEQAQVARWIAELPS